MDRAILWNPSLPGVKPTAGGRAPYPIFFQQEAVVALQEHLKGSPTQAIFGFLIGDVYRDPENGVLYAIIDKTLKLSQPIYGDKTEVVVSRLWDRMQEQLKKASGTLLGWYHSHPGQGGYLTTHDVETHEKFFTDPWQVAILVAAEAGGVTGRFFRSSQNADWHKTPLAFYELLQPDSIKPDGKKRSFIVWRNYKPYGPTLTGPRPKVSAPEPQPPEPEEEPEEVEAEAPEPPEPPEPPKKGDRGFRIMRSSADDIPIIKTSADDEPAPPPVPTPPPPPPKRPVFIPDEPPAPKPPPPPPRVPPQAPAPPPTPPPPAPKPGDLPWMVTPESVRAVPPPPIAPPREPPPPASRRTPSHAFRLLEADEEKKPAPKPRRRKRRGPWLRRFAILLLLAGAGAGGYWYFAIRNPSVLPGLLDRAKQLVSRVTARKPAPPPPPAPRRRPVTAPTAPTATTAPTAPVPGPVPVPQPVAPPSPFARFDRLTDSLSRAVRNFQDRAALFANGRMDCGGLASGLVAVENLWATYNVERRARMASFDQRRAAQDQAMYAAVDAVESGFERSGCPRP